MASLQLGPQFAQPDDQLDVADIGRSLARRWRRIALITIVATLIALYKVLISYPLFTIQGSLYLGDAQTSAGGGAALSGGVDFLSDFQSVSDVETQLELLQAKALIERAVVETGLNASITPVGATAMPFWKWRFIYGESIDAFAPQPTDLQVSYATLLDEASRGASFLVVFDGGGHYRLITGGGLLTAPTTLGEGVLNAPASGPGTAFLLKTGKSRFVPPAGSEYRLSIAPAAEVAQGLLAGAFTVGSGGTGSTPTKVAALQFLWTNPYQGKLFVDQVMNDFIATQLSWKTESASATEDFIAGQLNNITNSLTEADRNLAAYQSKTGLVDVPANAQAVISQLSQYEVQRTTVLLQKEALQQLDTVTAHPVDGLNPYLVSQTADPQLASLSTALATAEVQLQGSRVQFTGNAPEVQAQEAAIGKIEQAIRTLIQNDEALATRNLGNLDQLISNYEGQLKSEPAEALQVIALTRSSDVFGQLYVLLMQKEEEAEVSKAATIVDTRVVTPAELPLRSTQPKAALTVFTGTFLGLAFGIGLVLAQRALSGSYQTDDEIRRAIPLPVYGLVPKRPRTEAASSIFSARPQSPFSEAFRLMRSNLYQSATLQRSRVILITSASAGDGKTTVATNLAKFLADDGKRVVLIDADLHRGRLHEALKINQAPGLTEWLVTATRPAFQAVSGQRFMALTAGVFPPNPSELLNEPYLGEIIETLRAETDFVIIDCPPLPAVADTMSLGQHADLILSIVHIGHTGRRAFSVHSETVGTLAARHGMVINAVIGSAYGYGYGTGYGYGYGYADPRRQNPSLLDRIRRILK